MKCKLCSHQTYPFDHDVFGRYHWCQYCGFIYKDPKDQLSLADEQAIYSNHNNSIEDPDYVAYLKRFLKAAVFPYVEGKTALDFGSGPQPVLASILTRDYNYQVDIYDINYAPEKVYENKSYDLLVSTEVVEHLKDPLAYFYLFKELLKEGGLLAIQTEYHPVNDLKDLDKFREWYYIRDRSHISFYRQKTMAYLADQLNLQLIYSDNHRYSTFKKLKSK